MAKPVYAWTILDPTGNIDFEELWETKNLALHRRALIYKHLENKPPIHKVKIEIVD